MFITTAVNGNVATIKLDGRFTFSDHADFRQVTKEVIGGNCQSIDIDFARVDYLDSAAQGMLLLAREVARNQGKTISLVNCNGETRQILQMLSFEKLFKIT